jgi:hypothetical protein
MIGSLIISAAFTSAAEARNSTLLPLRGSVLGVAVNSTMQDGRSAASMSKDRLVPALCASSTITRGR